MDNIFHLRYGDTDYMVLIEAKAQPIDVTGGEWLATYGNKPKCARKQVEDHIRTMWEYMEPIARDTKLQFVAIVVSPDPATKEVVKPGYRNAELVLLPTDKLIPFIHERFNFDLNASHPAPELFRVSQSPFLDLLRLSMAIPALGHPELSSGIRYVDRCRRTLDQTLFEDFKPRAERWLINGSAGMGKSVLLAYAAAVLSSGRELYRFQGETGVKEATEVLETTAFDPDSGPIAMLAMSAKQLENLRQWFEFFVSLFEESDLTGNLHFRRPEFLLARSIGEWVTYKRTFSAVLLDEAHDLPEHAARSLKEVYDQQPFYLVLACDRHQQLRLSGANARVMTGFDFTGKHVRLKQIYRNPAPVYIASLALMFRWFGEGGPKVLPSDKDFSTCFGFDSFRLSPNEPTLTMKNDAHPANSWSHVVAAFPDVATAAATLRREKLGTKEVLWVRFSEEDPDFDYESLHRDFTYHNCRSREAHKLSDKYIKGQDFPVVVIEGFPSFMEKHSTEKEEAQMWQFRRELYLCASRATCFLYFVCDVKETKEVSAIRQEIARLLEAVGAPHSSPDANGAKPWTFRIGAAEHVRDYEVFSDLREDPVEESVSEDASDDLTRKPKSDTAPSATNAAVVKASPSSKSAGPLKKDSATTKPESSKQAPVQPAPTEGVTTDSNEEPEHWELTIEEPQTTKEFSELAGVEVYRVVEALNEIGCFEGPNKPISIKNLAKIAPHFRCYVVGYEDEYESAQEGEELDHQTTTATPTESSSVDPKSETPDDVYVIGGNVIVSDLAARIGIKPFQLLADLIKMEVFVAPHQEITANTATKICKIHGYRCRLDESLQTKGAKKVAPDSQAKPKKHNKRSEPKTTKPVAAKQKPLRSRGMNSLSHAFESADGSDQERESRSFAIRRGVHVRRGHWIEDSSLGIGKILQVCSKSQDRDAHKVWFAGGGKTELTHPLRGRTNKILHVSKISEDILRRAPST
ncbi:hypothetical protein [Haloferula sp.]|uniref:hypothetical protein n=1 Tax=Haloferula sp. TaxID=2497595 RepID=UPI00329FBF9D